MDRIYDKGFKDLRKVQNLRIQKIENDDIIRFVEAAK